MKVLFTGMASSHCKKPSNTTFFSTLADVVSEFAEVVWETPKLSWVKEDLDQFDLIIFGMTPPTALSANKIYGAMHLLGLMYHSSKLRLVVDGQQMWQYKNSLEAVKRDVEVLFSKFFSKRTGYSEAKNHRRKYIDLAASYLSSGYWPKTYYPSVPWKSTEKVSEVLGFIPTGRLQGLNLDSMLILPEPAAQRSRLNSWAIEDVNRSWYVDLQPTLRFPGIDVRLSKFSNDFIAGNDIRTSMGLIVPPQDRKIGTWWSYKTIQGLNSGTPIATLWQESINLNESWGYLPYQIEDMTESERLLVAKNQLESYYSAIPSRSRLIEEIRYEMTNSIKERI